MERRLGPIYTCVLSGFTILVPATALSPVEHKNIRFLFSKRYEANVFFWIEEVEKVTLTLVT